MGSLRAWLASAEVVEIVLVLELEVSAFASASEQGVENTLNVFEEWVHDISGRKFTRFWAANLGWLATLRPEFPIRAVLPRPLTVTLGSTTQATSPLLNSAMNALLAQAVESTPMTDGIPWIDKVGAVLLVIFGILGFWRGLWWQVIRLAGFIGAFAAARFFSPQAEPMITETFNITDHRFSQGMAWLVIFIAALIVVVLLGKLGKSMLDAMQLGLVDRLGGALAGAVTAILIHSAFLAVMSLFAQAEWLNDQLVGSWERQPVHQSCGRVSRDCGQAAVDLDWL